MTQTADVVDFAGITNLADVLAARVARSPDAAAYRRFDAEGSEWLTTTWAEFADEVCRWQAALRVEDLQAGDRVAIMLGNRRETEYPAAKAGACLSVRPRDACGPGAPRLEEARWYGARCIAPSTIGALSDRE